MTVVDRLVRRLASRDPGFALAVCLPLGCYLWTLGGTTYWLDAGEFNAAAVALGVPHPPGHPLTPLFGKCMSLVPVGNLSARIAFGQALCAAFAAGFLYLAVRRSLAPRDEGTVLPARAVALAVTWVVALCPGYWLQAVRTEVYALQALLLCVAMERMSACEFGRARAQALSCAALALGLGLANNHLMAVVALPAVVPVLWGALSARGVRVAVAPLVVGALGLGAYVYLPVRSAVGASIDLGSPHTLDNFLWVLSARVYAKELGQGGSQPLGERFVDALVLLHENLHVVLVLAALGGAYLWLRTAGERRFGLAVLLWAAGAFLARPFVGPVRANPDVLGYLIPAFAGCAWAAGALVHRVVAELAERTAPPVARAALWVMLPMLALAQGPVGAARADLSRFAATEAFDDARLHGLPPRALVVTSLPQSVFRAWEARALEHARPDVAVLPLPFLRYPGAVEVLRRQAPEWVPLTESYLHTGRLDAARLDLLAQQRPLFVELDPRLSTYLGASVVPEGVMHRWGGGGGDDARLRLAEVRRRILLATLRRRVAGDLGDQETGRQLLGIHYTDAVYYTLRGRRDAALDALASARTLYPQDTLLRQFGEALERSGPGQRVDLRPYLVTPP